MYKDFSEKKRFLHFVGDKNSVLSAYYDAIADSSNTFEFLSPVNHKAWLTKAANWLSEAKSVIEVGCGYGQLCYECLKKTNSIQEYYLIDISEKFLCLVEEKLQASNLLSFKNNIFIQGSIEDTLIVNSFNKKQFDVAVAINILQDVDTKKALKNINSLLVPGGYLRATFINRETQDAFWGDDLSYDPVAGRSYTCSKLHQSINLPPLGIIETDESKKPFYRVEQYFSRVDVERLLLSADFEIESINVILFPIEMLKKRWTSIFHTVSLNQKQEDLLKMWGGFPDAFDVIARKR